MSDDLQFAFKLDEGKWFSKTWHIYQIAKLLYNNMYQSMNKATTNIYMVFKNNAWQYINTMPAETSNKKLFLKQQIRVVLFYLSLQK